MNSNATIHNLVVSAINPHFLRLAEKVSRHYNNIENTLSQGL